MEIGSLTRMDAGATAGPVNTAGTQQGSAPKETQKTNDVQAVSSETTQAQGEKSGTGKKDSVELKPLRFIPTADELKTMSYAMNRFVEMLTSDLKFEVHEKTNEIMVKFVNEKTGEVLKEYPSKEFLDMIARIRDYVGMMIDKKV